MKIQRIMFLTASMFILSSCNSNSGETSKKYPDVKTANITSLNCCYDYGANDVVTLKINDEKIAWSDEVTQKDFTISEELSGKSVSNVERDTQDDRLLYATLSGKLTTPIEGKKSGEIKVLGSAFKRTKVTTDNTKFSLNIDKARAHLNKEDNNIDVLEPTTAEPTHTEHYAYYGVGNLFGAITNPNIDKDIYKPSTLNITNLSPIGFTGGSLMLQKVKNNVNGDFVISLKDTTFEESVTDCSVTLKYYQYKNVIYNMTSTAYLKLEFKRNLTDNSLSLNDSTAYFIIDNSKN